MPSRHCMRLLVVYFAPRCSWWPVSEKKHCGYGLMVASKMAAINIPALLPNLGRGQLQPGESTAECIVAKANGVTADICGLSNFATHPIIA
eukprot:100813-Chlamydomonas_euryale.AAC.1